MHVTRVTYHDPTPHQLRPDTAFLSDFSLRFQNLHLCNTEIETHVKHDLTQRSRPRHLHTDLTIIIPQCFRVRSCEHY